MRKWCERHTLHEDLELRKCKGSTSARVSTWTAALEQTSRRLSSCMERPLGPRAPQAPGDRNRAFESIFGRPSAGHQGPQQRPPPGAEQGAYLQAGHPAQYGRSPSPSGYPGYPQQPPLQQPLQPPQPYARGGHPQLQQDPNRYNYQQQQAPPANYYPNPFTAWNATAAV